VQWSEVQLRVEAVPPIHVPGYLYVQVPYASRHLTSLDFNLSSADAEGLAQQFAFLSSAVKLPPLRKDVRYSHILTCSILLPFFVLKLRSCQCPQLFSHSLCTRSRRTYWKSSYMRNLSLFWTCQITLQVRATWSDICVTHSIKYSPYADCEMKNYISRTII
jgi:hypothetical protein